MANLPEVPLAENPEKLSDLTSTGPKKWAAGVPGVIAAFADVLEEGIPIRGTKALFSMNKQGGFDCSSCAWPDPDEHRSPVAEYCENGVKALAEEATLKKVDAKFFAKHSVYDLSLLSDHEIGKKGRITEPMYLPKCATHYEPISWDAAFEKIANHLNALDSPHEAIFYTSGRTGNETSFLYQLFTKEFGTNNLPDCSNMCHESSGSALRPIIGIGKGTVTLEDFYDTDLILIIGQNPGTNAPRMMSALEKGKKSGAKIVAINPLPESGLMGFRNPQELKGVIGTGVSLADHYLPVKINGDMALLKAFEKLILEAEEKNPGKVLDHDFLENHTAGFTEFSAQFKSLDLSLLAEQSGIDMEDIRQVAELLSTRKRIIFCWGMGLTQQPNGVEMIREIINIAIMRGSIGKQGAGLCPVRGHSNVQGNRTMMINEKPTQAQLDKIKEVFGFEPPREHGYDVVNAIKAMHAGKAKVFFAMGGNFLSASPDTNYTSEALRKVRLTVQVSTKLNRSHLVHGEEAIILPPLARSDEDWVNGKLQFISTENSMGVVQSSQGVLKPISDTLLNETQIVCRLAKATLGNKSLVDWDRYSQSYDDIRDLIEKCIPGFENYNERVRHKSGFYLPNGPRAGKFQSEKFGTKIPFTISPLPVNILAENEYLMATTRTHDQFNTTIYGLDDRYRGIKNERRVIFMNKKDIEKAGLKEGDTVDLFNYDDQIERIARLFVVVSYPIPERNTMTYYPETNVLVSITNVVGESNMPAAKYVRIQIRKHQNQ